MAKFFKFLKCGRKLFPLFAFIFKRISSRYTKEKAPVPEHSGSSKSNKAVLAIEIILVIISIACTAFSITALVGCIRGELNKKKSTRRMHPECTHCKYAQIKA